MEPGHLLCRRRARSRPQGAGAASTSKQGTSDGRGEAAHSTGHRIREGGTGKHRATEGPHPPERPSTSRKRRTSRPAVTEHVGDESSFALYRSAAPDSTAGTAAKCVWTGRAQPISWAASTQEHTSSDRDCARARTRRRARSAQRRGTTNRSARSASKRRAAQRSDRAGFETELNSQRTNARWTGRRKGTWKAR